MNHKYNTAPAGASSSLDLIEIIQWHQFTALVYSLVNTNPGFVRAFAEIAIRGAHFGNGRAVLARLGPVPKPSERAEAEFAYRSRARHFKAGQRHRERLAELLIETVSDVLGRESAR